MSSGLAGDASVRRLAASRNSPAVLKLQLAQLRVTAPDVSILVFEGPDDKIIYAQWIRRTRSDLNYEPFPCGGKHGVLSLRLSISRDKTGLGAGVFFFVDRDFDDLKGGASDSKTFMTEMYSVENYLVSERVVDDILKNEFPCSTMIELRLHIVDIFSRAYSSFLDVTRELNRRIFVARRLGLRIDEKLPRKISAIASVTLETVTQSANTPEILVELEPAPDQAVWQTLSAEFDNLDPRSRYRGKFALMFFRSWIDALYQAFLQRQAGLFNEIHPDDAARASELVVSNYASKSDMPSGLGEFIASVR